MRWFFIFRKNINMKNTLWISLIFLVFLSCKKGGGTINNKNESDEVLVKEVKNKNCVIDNNLYSSLDYVSWGDSWFDEKLNKEYVFRIIVSSVGEEVYLYRELFEIKEEGPVYFINRERINSKEIGLEYFNTIPNFKWISYNNVNLILEKKSYRLKLVI